MLEPQIRGRAALPADELPVRNCSSNSIVGIAKCLPQNDMVTWLMNRTNDPHSIISAFIFVDIAANTTIAMVCKCPF